jgi:hypothetical protein
MFGMNTEGQNLKIMKVSKPLDRCRKIRLPAYVAEIASALQQLPHKPFDMTMKTE